jgi:coenzyme F420-reducing hydrogenase delta subunit
MDYKKDYTFEKALDRVEHPQPFKDIAKHLCEELNRDDDKVENAIKHLKEISWEIGTTGIEYLSEKDGQKMREYINILENRIDELEQ